MANTFLAALGHGVGKSMCEHDLLPTAREIMELAKSKGREIVLPVDAVVAKKFEANAPSRVVEVDGVGGDEMILDIGPRSIEHVCSVLARAKTLVWNGPFGAFELEPFDNGTVEVAEAAAELTAAGKLVSVAGGGDTVSALNAAGVSRAVQLCLDGGRRLPGMAGGQGHCRASRRCVFDEPPCLVSRFRSSHRLLAHSGAKFGIKGTLATL